MPKKRQLNCGICGSEKRITILKSGKEKLICDKCRREKSSLWQKQNKERVNEKKIENGLKIITIKNMIIVKILNF